MCLILLTLIFQSILLESYPMDCLYSFRLTTFWINALGAGRIWYGINSSGEEVELVCFYLFFYLFIILFERETNFINRHNKVQQWRFYRMSMTHYVLFMQSHANSATIWERICKHKKPVVEPRQSSLFLSSIEVNDMTYKESTFFIFIFFIISG